MEVLCNWVIMFYCCWGSRSDAGRKLVSPLNNKEVIKYVRLIRVALYGGRDTNDESRNGDVTLAVSQPGLPVTSDFVWIMGIFLISKRFECKMMPYLHKYLRIFHYYLVTLSDFYCSLFCLQFWLVCIFPIMKNFLINHFSSFPTCWDVSFALLLDVKLF